MTANASAYIPPDLLVRLERLALAAKRRIRGSMQGRRRAQQLGSSLEFADYRAYVPGDDIRRFDWGVYGRTGKPFIKQYMDEQELHVQLLVDASPSMDFGESGGALTAGGVAGNKFAYAKRLAACVGYIALASYDRAEAACFAGHAISSMPPLRGKGSAERLFRFLETAPILSSAKPVDKEAGMLSGGGGQSADPFTVRPHTADPHTADPHTAAPHTAGYVAASFAAPFPQLVALSRGPGPGVTWVFSDFLAESGVQEALDYLAAAQREVVAVQVLARQELQPELLGDLRLIDSETNGGKEVAVSARVLRAYQAALQEHTDGLRKFCGERGMAHVFVPTDTPLEEAVFRLFRQAGVLQ